MNKLKLAMIGVAALLSVNFTACSEDKLGDSIFDTTDYPLDRSLYSFPLDTFVKKNFLEPYNMRYLYKMQDIGSDRDYNLVPCSYDQSVTLAVLCKYLWYDVYKEVVGEQFLKQYSPRIIHVIGSPAYNPTSGTIKLGTAEGGLKITLFNAESLSPAVIDYMNEYFIKTMHHEFSHILHQNKSYPTAFNLISNTNYNTISWQDTPDSVAVGQGFVSPYASSQAREDWVEIIANYIVKDSLTWERMLNSATRSWELAEDVDAKHFASCFVNGTTETTADATQFILKPGVNRDSVGYWYANGTTSGTTASTFKVVRKYIQRDSAGFAIPGANGEIQYLKQQETDGRTIILTKLEMAKTWLREKFNYDLDAVRNAVQRRQWLTDANGNYVFDAQGNFINGLITPRANGTIVIDSLRQEVEKYKALQQ